MDQLSLFLLGPFDARHHDHPLTGFETVKVRALLAYLAVHADRAHSREVLAALLWPELPDESARTYLRQALANLRAVLGDRSADVPTLLIARDTVQLNPAASVALDIATFRTLLASSARHPHRRAVPCPACARRLEQAIALYRGSFLDQFALRDSAPFEEWVTLSRE